MANSAAIRPAGPPSLNRMEKSGCVGLVFRSETLREGAESETPTAHVILRFSLNDEDGNIMVTRKVPSLEELRQAIDSVKEELDGILEQARQRFAIDSRQGR